MRQSNLGNVADRLVKVLPEDQCDSTCKCVINVISAYAVLVLHYFVYLRFLVLSDSVIYYRYHD